MRPTRSFARTPFARPVRPAALALAAACVAAAAGAQGWIPRGAQRQVNTYTTSDQGKPAVAIDATGRAIVVWESFGSNGNDASLRSIQGRLYAADGSPVAGQFQVNTTTDEEQMTPAVAMNGTGAFVVVWESDSLAGAGTDFDIRARIFDATGQAVGDDFLVNATTGQQQGRPAVAMRADGEFAVVWQSDVDATASEDLDILGQLFDASGGAIGPVLAINSTTSGAQQAPAIAADPDGDVIVAWQSASSPGGDTTTDSIQALWLPIGELPGSQFQVNADLPVTGDSAPAVAMAPDGRFVVAWEANNSLGSDTSLSSIHARQYGADGSPVAVPFEVNTWTPDAQRFPAVAADALGRILVAWQSYGAPAGGDTSEYGVMLRGLGASGGSLGGETQANSYTTSNQRYPRVAMNASGRAAVVWESYGSPDGDPAGTQSVQLRFYVLPNLFADGFEGGATSRWTVP